ncbi:MAG: SRPBCC family protein [Rhodospirillales bacterium]
MLRTVILILCAVGVPIVGVLAWGWTLPATVTAGREARLPAPPSRVFALVTDVEGQARWRRDVADVRPTADGTGWIDRTRRGAEIVFRTVTKEPDRLFEIAYTASLGFSGRWTGTFAPDGDGTRLAIVETVTTPGIVGRLLGRLLAPPGHHADLYLEDLRKAL